MRDGVRRHPALLVRPRRRRLAHRRDARDRQGPRAARRPSRDAGRPPAHPGAREQAGVLDEPPRGARRAAALARARRRGTTRRGSSSARPTCSSLDQLIPFYGAGEDELNLAFNFLFVHAELEADAMRAIVEAMEEKLPAASWPVYTGSNHDAGRLATRWAGGDPERARVALMMLLTLRGTPFLYYGDEIGLPDVAARPRRCAGSRCRTAPAGPSATATPAARRCRGRAEPGAGFTRAGRRAVAAARRHRGAQRRRPARGRRLDAALHARPDRAAARRARPARRRLRDAARARGRVGLPARRRPRGRAQPLGGRGDGRRARRGRSRWRPTARATGRRWRAR